LALGEIFKFQTRLSRRYSSVLSDADQWSDAFRPGLLCCVLRLNGGATLWVHMKIPL